MDDLVEGYRRFRANGWPERRRVFETLSEAGQNPKALVVACVDSRLDPAMIFDVGPGELLTVRNVANLVPPYAPDGAHHSTSAALEFGVRVLEIPRIIVVGHSRCGGVQALLKGAPENARDFIAPWIAIAQPARAVALRCDAVDEQQECGEQEVIKLSIANLMTFPWIAERVAAGKLTLHGAWFAIYTGTLSMLQPDGTFQALES